MKIGIMQPYFIPYIGYWQLINAVDKYIIYDDVNFIKGGWINRNRILVNGQPKYFNIPMINGSSNRLINEIGVSTNVKLINKNLRIIDAAYKKAPHYTEVYPLIESVLKTDENNLAKYIEHSLRLISDYLGITTEMISSSSLNKNSTLKAQDKILHMCELLGATEYYNAFGGINLYSFRDFNEKGIELKFIKTGEIKYRQFTEEFQSNLSILDIMMFNSRESIKKMLDNFELITEGQKG